jgi:hypothetical protein
LLSGRIRDDEAYIYGKIGGRSCCFDLQFKKKKKKKKKEEKEGRIGLLLCLIVCESSELQHEVDMKR